MRALLVRLSGAMQQTARTAINSSNNSHSGSDHKAALMKGVQLLNEKIVALWQADANNSNNNIYSSSKSRALSASDDTSSRWASSTELPQSEDARDVLKRLLNGTASATDQCTGLTHTDVASTFGLGSTIDRDLAMLHMAPSPKQVSQWS